MTYRDDRGDVAVKCILGILFLIFFVFVADIILPGIVERREFAEGRIVRVHYYDYNTIVELDNGVLVNLMRVDTDIVVGRSYAFYKSNSQIFGLQKGVYVEEV